MSVSRLEEVATKYRLSVREVREGIVSEVNMVLPCPEHRNTKEQEDIIFQP